MFPFELLKFDFGFFSEISCFRFGCLQWKLKGWRSRARSVTDRDTSTWRWTSPIRLCSTWLTLPFSSTRIGKKSMCFVCHLKKKLYVLMEVVCLLESYYSLLHCHSVRAENTHWCGVFQLCWLALLPPVSIKGTGSRPVPLFSWLEAVSSLFNLCRVLKPPFVVLGR